MPRQTITFSDPNHDWLQQKVDSKEFRNHTEAVNDALRKVREMESGIDAIRARLIAAENSGFTDMTVDEIWKEARRDAQISP